MFPLSFHTSPVLPSIRRAKPRFDLVNIGELGEGATAVRFQIVHAGDPIGVHGRLLFLRILATAAFDLNDEMEQVWTSVREMCPNYSLTPFRRLEKWGGGREEAEGTIMKQKLG
jgi:hypothetical protein